MDRKPMDKCRVHIRPFIRRDLIEVMAIERESFEVPWTEEQLIEVARQWNVIVMVAELSDRIVGYLVCERNKKALTVLTLAVAADVRRHGIGSQMIDKLRALLAPYRRSSITLRVRDSNLGGQIFFREHGFCAEAVLRKWYDDPTDDDAYVMVYRLGGRR